MGVRMSEDSDSDKVISFAERTGIKFEARGSEDIVDTNEHCPHFYRVIHRKERTVRCRECSAKLDPFDVLLDNADDHERRLRDHQNLRKASERLRADVEVLERLERNVRARIGKKTGQMPTVVGSKWQKDDYSRAHRSASMVTTRIDGRLLVVGEGFEFDVSIETANTLGHELCEKFREHWERMHK
jgi:hypothetical protein